MKQSDVKSSDSMPSGQNTNNDRNRLILNWCKTRLINSELTESAGNISYTILLSMVPMLAILLAIFTQFPEFGTLRGTLETYFSQGMMPEKTAKTILKYLNTFATNAGRVSFFGGIALLFAIFTSLSAIESAFNKIWNIVDTRPLYKRFSLYLLLGTLTPLSIGVALFFTSHVILVKHGFATSIPIIGNFISPIISFLWAIIAFTLLYRILPNRQILWKDAIAGGLFAAVGFEIAIRLFSFYMVNFNFYEKVYGTLAAFPIFIAWIYISSMIMLLGAATAAILPEIRNRSWHIPVYPGKHFFDTLKIIHILTHPERQEKFISRSDIEKLTSLSGNEVEFSIRNLKRLGWVQSPQKSTLFMIFFGKWTQQQWKWSGDIKKITLASVFEECVFTGNHQDILADEIKRIIDREMDITLSEYFQSPYAIMGTKTVSAPTSGQPIQQ